MIGELPSRPHPDRIIVQDLSDAVRDIEIPPQHGRDKLNPLDTFIVACYPSATNYSYDMSEVPKPSERLNVPERGRFHGQNALVTGVSDPTSIGAAVVRRLEREGAAGIRTVATPGSAEVARSFLTEFESSPSDIDWVGVDLSDPSEILHLVHETRDRFGQIQVLVINHGISRAVAFRDMTYETLHPTIATNLESPMLLTRYAVTEGLLERGRGRVIINGSFLGINGSDGHEAYAAAKAGLIGFIRSAKWTLADAGITINGVFPGDIDTRMSRKVPELFQRANRTATPMGRKGTPEDVAFNILHFADPEAEFTTGEILVVDGGLGGGVGGARRLAENGWIDTTLEERRLVFSYRREQAAHQEGQK